MLVWLLIVDIKLIYWYSVMFDMIDNELHADRTRLYWHYDIYVPCNFAEIYNVGIFCMFDILYVWVISWFCDIGCFKFGIE